MDFCPNLVHFYKNGLLVYPNLINPDCSNSKILEAQGAANKPEDIKRLQQEKPAVITSTNQKLHQNKNQELQQNK